MGKHQQKPCQKKRRMNAKMRKKNWIESAGLQNSPRKALINRPKSLFFLSRNKRHDKRTASLWRLGLGRKQVSCQAQNPNCAIVVQRRHVNCALVGTIYARAVAAAALRSLDLRALVGTEIARAVAAVALRSLDLRALVGTIYAVAVPVDKLWMTGG